VYKRQPQYGPGSIETLKRNVAESMARSPKELYDLVPAASGIYFVGCPNCDGGSQESGVFDYSLDLGDRGRCRFCDMVFPNEQFPNNRELVIAAPSGAQQVYRWYEAPDGRQHFFEAHAWTQRWQWTQNQALLLANLYTLTGDPEYGDRAAAIVGRYAQVYPDYPVRYDYPFRPKKFYPADQKPPYGDLEPYRGAKFYWWGYADIPERLALAYDLLAAGPSFERQRELLGEDIRERIERDLIRLGYEFTSAHEDSYSNMSPGMYHDMIVAGRVIGAPEMVHEAVERFRTLVTQKFFFDGWWCEGAPSYHAQTVGNLQRVADAAEGYDTPESWTGTRLRTLDLAAEVPMLAKALRVSRDAVLPDGRMVPINDTWSTDHRDPTQTAASVLWPALGHAALGAGSGDAQFQAHLNWSGGFGHPHADNGSMFLYAFGRELISDLGYTHTRYRNWTINTASHNVVVVDMRSQPLGSAAAPTTGNLRCFDDSNPHVRFADVDASPAYPGCKTYRRRLVHVHAGDGLDYVVDVFDVEGGETHDWFLHGSADEEGALESSLDFPTTVESLVPGWGGRAEPQNEQELDVRGERFHPYGFLWSAKSAEAPARMTATWRYGSDGLRAHLFPENGATAYRFASPAIRGAKEIDADLAKHLRHGLMLRHAGPRSRFVAVHEPFRGATWIEGVEWDGSTLRVQRGGVEDTIRLDHERVTVSSSEGWAYDSGTPYTGQVAALERGETFVLRTDRPLPGVPFVRLTFEGGRSFLYRVKVVEGDRLILAEDPGFEFDAESKTTRFLYFPHDTFSGVPTYTVYIGGN